LKGPARRSANEDVIELIERWSPSKARAFARQLNRYKNATREERANPSLRFPGFGHAVYKTWDPRARILKKSARRVADARGVGHRRDQESVRES
jgi:citrate synthase